MNALMDTARPGRLLGERPERLPLAGPATLDARLQDLFSRWSASRADMAGFSATLADIANARESLKAAGNDGFVDHIRQLQQKLKTCSLSTDKVVRVFAAISVAVSDLLQINLHDEQLFAGWVMLHGSIAEMHTGEGKTLTASLPAIAMALTGTPVHVITVNEYLVKRDAGKLAPLYARFGLRTGIVTEDMTDEARRHAYAADIVYCTNKQVVFDYLRDLQLLGSERMGLQSQLRTLLTKQSATPVMRGLCFAVVDEADSVMIDDARTPLILAEPWQAERAVVTEATVALGIARTLHEGADFRLQQDSRSVNLTPTGLDALRGLAAQLDGVWRFERYRAELVRQALTALHLFRLDRDYLVLDGCIQLIDESTGRAMPDRKLQHGLHRMLEVKERCEVTGDNEVLAAISFQQFFTRYCHLSGMSGTVHEVRAELGRVYGVNVVRIPPHKVDRRQVLPPLFAVDRTLQLKLVLDDVLQRHGRGQPVLIGTRTVELSEYVSDLLTERNVPHQLLNARQDADEAAAVARSGCPGAVMVATNMAGRGTDIPLHGQAAKLGGLHVINLEINASSRVDRQLFGRAARQGDPGSCQSVLSLKDELLTGVLPSAALVLLERATNRWPQVAQTLSSLAARYAQRRCEKAHARQRIAVFNGYEQLKRQLAFSGDRE